MAKTAAVEIEGMIETLKAVRRRLRPTSAEGDEQAELRGAAGDCATAPRRPARAGRRASLRCPGRAHGRRARSGSRATGSRSSPSVAAKVGRALLWGSEQGPKSDPNHFAVAPERRPATGSRRPSTGSQSNEAVELPARPSTRSSASTGSI